MWKAGAILILKPTNAKLLQSSVEAHSVRNLQAPDKCNDTCLCFTLLHYGNYSMDFIGIKKIRNIDMI